MKVRPKFAAVLIGVMIAIYGHIAYGAELNQLVNSTASMI